MRIFERLRVRGQHEDVAPKLIETVTEYLPRKSEEKAPVVMTPDGKATCCSCSMEETVRR